MKKPRVDKDGCYTLPDGSCDGCPHCIHGPKSYEVLAEAVRSLLAHHAIREATSDTLVPRIILLQRLVNC